MASAGKLTARLTITPLTGLIGAQVEGVDLSREIPPDVADQIRQAFYRHLVLWDEMMALHRAPTDFGGHPRKVVRVTAGRVVPTAATS